MDIRTGILSTAQSLGIDPLDLATAISYETAGTFDPTKAGPTTQWGQHRGLIQFGEPQAQQYGVDWNDPVGSQLGPQGAVAGYLRDTGVKPGMGLLDIYSAINAGGVGRYNRSDANNGGAPGTVRDKVEQQMAGHRAKAAALLGDERQVMSTSSPAMPTQEAAPMQQEKVGGLLGRLFPDMGADRADELRLGFQGLLHNPNEAKVGAIQARMSDRAEGRKEAKAQAAAQQQANKTAQWLASQPGGQEYAQAIASGALPAGEALTMWRSASQGQEPTALMQQYGLARQEGYDGSFMDYQTDLKRAGASSSTVNVNNSDGAPMLGTIPQGFEAFKDPETGAFRMRPVPGGPEDTTEKDALANEGKRRSGDVVIEDINRVLGMTSDGGMPVAGAGGGLLSGIPGTQAHDASKLLQTIRANVGFDRLQQMRDSSPTGGALGAINQSEMTLLNSALGALEQSQSTPQFEYNLKRLKGIYEEIVHGAGGNSAPSIPDVPNFSDMSDEELDAYIQKMGGA